MMLPDTIDHEIIRLFPSVKSGVVERGLWRIPLFFDRSFGKTRGCIRLRRYIVHMAEMGAAKKSMQDFVDEVAELIAEGDSTRIY